MSTASLMTAAPDVHPIRGGERLGLGSGKQSRIQVVWCGRRDFHVRPSAGLEALGAFDSDHAVDLGGVGFAAGDSDVLIDGVYEYPHTTSHAGGEALRTDDRRTLH